LISASLNYSSISISKIKEPLGLRVLSTVQAVYLLSIYDKSDQENIRDKELKEVVKKIPN
jgi:hypothetical protein